MRFAFRPSELSLRSRLLLALVGLAAVALAVFAFVAYRALDDYLTDRVDQQAQAALPAMAMTLFDELRGSEAEALGLTDPRAGLPGPDGGPGPGLGSQLPPGTYGALLGPDGEVVKEVQISLGEKEALAVPAIPADLEAGTPRQPGSPVTVGSTAGGSEQFRLVAGRGPGGTTTVVAVPLGDTAATLDRLAAIELVVAAVVLAVLAFAAWWVIGAGLRPLRRMGEVAGDIAAGDLSRRVEPANERTEGGRLGLALNGMLSQIERAFAEREASEARLRQFLADASHELRTPLAAIRGYAELHRLGASREPDEVARAMDRIEAESTRMSGLVEDLFTLARIDEVPVREAAPVALDELLAEACEDARAAAPGRRIELEAAPGVVVEGDGDQLRRVFVNLLANAVVHTPEGTPIEVSLRREGAEAVAVVRDHGPGLPPGEPQAVFERFWRGSASRGREDGGAGLGLAIVAAIVAAHDGAAAAENAAGGGAAFTVRLPLAAGAA